MPPPPPVAASFQSPWAVWLSPSFADRGGRWDAVLRLLAALDSELWSEARAVHSSVAELWSPMRRTADLGPGRSLACFLGADGVGPAVSDEVRRAAFLPAALADAVTALPGAASYELILSPHVTAVWAQRLPAGQFRALVPKLCYLPPVPPAARRSGQADATGHVFICTGSSTTAVVARALRDVLPGPVVVHPPLTPVATLDWSAARHWRLHPEDDSDASLDALLAAATAQGCTTEVLPLGHVCAATGFPTGTPTAQQSPGLRKLAQTALAPRPAPLLEPPPLQPVFSEAGLADRWQTIVERRLARPGGDDPGFHFPTDFLRPDRSTPPSATTLAQEFLQRMQPWFDVARPNGAACDHLRLLHRTLSREAPSPIVAVLLAEIGELLGTSGTEHLSTLRQAAADYSPVAGSLARLLGRAGALDEIPAFLQCLGASSRHGFSGSVVRTATFGSTHLFRGASTSSDDAVFHSLLTVLADEARAGLATPTSVDLQLQLTLATAGPAASCKLLDAVRSVAPTLLPIHVTQLAWFGHHAEAARTLRAADVPPSGDAVLSWLHGLAFATAGRAEYASAAWRRMIAADPGFFTDAVPCHPDFWMWQAFALTCLGCTDDAAPFIQAARSRDILFPLKARRLRTMKTPAPPSPLPTARVPFTLTLNPPIYDFGTWMPRGALAEQLVFGESEPSPHHI